MMFSLSLVESVSKICLRRSPSIIWFFYLISLFFKIMSLFMRPSSFELEESYVFKDRIVDYCWVSCNCKSLAIDFYSNWATCSCRLATIWLVVLIKFWHSRASTPSSSSFTSSPTDCKLSLLLNFLSSWKAPSRHFLALPYLVLRSRYCFFLIKLAWIFSCSRSSFLSLVVASSKS